MKRFKNIGQLADHLERQVLNRQLPSAFVEILEKTGQNAHHQAQDIIIGRVNPLPATGPFPQWAPLKDATIAAKSRNGLGKNGNPKSMLYATGNLHDHIAFHVDRTQKTMTLGTNVEYAAMHEYGDPIHNIPARPFLAPAIIRAVEARKNANGKMLNQALGGNS